MKITKSELKIIMSEFEMYATRLLQCDYQTGLPNLKKFLASINDEPLISEFIEQKRTKKYDFSNWSLGTVYQSMGDTPNEEIVATYDLLTYFAENNVPYQDITFCYSGRKVADDIYVFNERIVSPLIAHIERYLNRLMIRMEEEDTKSIVINAPGGQVNIAQDNATLNATQNNGLDASEVQKLIETILNTIPSEISDDDKLDVTESLSVIKEETEKSSPNGSILRLMSKVLNTVKSKFPDAVDFTNAIIGLMNLLQPYLV